MSKIGGKRRKVQSWLPNQVAYGVDVSDNSPENWFAFGDEAEDADPSAKGWLPKKQTPGRRQGTNSSESV